MKEARKKSIINLSRSGTSSLIIVKATGSYPSVVFTSIIEGLGGKVIIANKKMYQEYRQFASEPEYDCGSWRSYMQLVISGSQ